MFLAVIPPADVKRKTQAEAATHTHTHGKEKRPTDLDITDHYPWVSLRRGVEGAGRVGEGGRGGNGHSIFTQDGKKSC